MYQDLFRIIVLVVMIGLVAFLGWIFWNSRPRRAKKTEPKCYWTFKDPERAKFICIYSSYSSLMTTRTAEGCAYSLPTTCNDARRCLYLKYRIGDKWKRYDQVWKCHYCQGITYGLKCHHCGAEFPSVRLDRAWSGE